MIIIVEASDIIDKAIISAFDYLGYNTKAHDGLINQFIDHIAHRYNGKYSKEDLMASFNRVYKRNVVLAGNGNVKSSTHGGAGLAGTSNRPVQDSDPNSYEASPNIVKRLYSPRVSNMVWGRYQLNKYEQDIVNFINTNDHNKMDAIRKKPAFSILSNKLIKNAPVQKVLFRKENSLRFNKAGDIISFDLRSFSVNPYHLMLVKFVKGQGQDVLYRVTGLRGINIGAYDDFTKLSVYEDEYLCTGNCKITAIGKNGNTVVVDASAV